jgi:hypothetical protein
MRTYRNDELTITVSDKGLLVPTAEFDRRRRKLLHVVVPPEQYEAWCEFILALRKLKVPDVDAGTCICLLTSNGRIDEV